MSDIDDLIVLLPQVKSGSYGKWRHYEPSEWSVAVRVALTCTRQLRWSKIEASIAYESSPTKAVCPIHNRILGATGIRGILKTLVHSY